MSIYLFDILPDIEVDFQRYWESEEKVIKPALEKLGYVVGRIYDGERDSFGPLSRCIDVTKDGQKETVWYG